MLLSSTELSHNYLSASGGINSTERFITDSFLPLTQLAEWTDIFPGCIHTVMLIRTLLQRKPICWSEDL